MKILLSILTMAAVCAANCGAGLITGVPTADDQDVMIMPMVSIMATSGTGANPTAGSVNIAFTPPGTPTLRSLNEWSPGDWFADSAAWRADLSQIDGTVSGMPSANAGNGDLFNSQYGFMFMSMGNTMMAAIPAGHSLAVRLDSVTSPDLDVFNYGRDANRWDQVFDAVDSQVLWSGLMWHPYFVMPATTLPGSYTAVFEVFIAGTPFTGATGNAQYDSAAAAALKNPDFNSAFVTFNFNVVPEPGTLAFLGFAALLFAVFQFRRIAPGGQRR